MASITVTKAEIVQPPLIGWETAVEVAEGQRTLQVAGTVPSLLWKRLGTKVLLKLRSGARLSIEVTVTVSVDAKAAEALEADLQQAVEDLGIQEQINVEET